MAIREEESRKRMKADAAGLVEFFAGLAALHPAERITFLCIGTDRSTGDALGPLTGSKLTEYGFPNVVGTLPDPCDANNLVDRLAAIGPDQYIVAVDACLGPAAALGCYFVAREPLRPAQSVGISLPAVGHASLAAIVDVNGPWPYRILQTTPLHRVMVMSNKIAAAAAQGFGFNFK